MTLRLFLLSPETIVAARVNQASFSYPLAEVAFDDVTTGAYGDVLPGMTILFGTSAGSDDLGRQRVRKAATSDTLYFGRSSEGTRDGEVDLQNDAYITVLNDFRIWGKVPHIDIDGDGNATIYKDADLVVSDRTTDPPPVANLGPGLMATIDDAVPAKITVNFDGTSSFAVADGASISTYAWDVDDGTITVGTSASSAITATFPAGFRWVSLTVTDDNGKTHTARCPVFARDPADDDCISGWEITAHRITPQGQTLSVRILSDIDAGDYPDGTLAMIMDGEPADADDRSHMLFIGWHQTDSADIQGQRTATLRDVTLNLVDVAGRLDAIPGFAQVVEAADSPATWTEMASPNMDKYLHYLLHWHSTALELADWTNSGTGGTFAFVTLGNEGQSLFGQVNRCCNSMVPDYHLTCNRRGQLRVLVDPLLQDSGDRTATVQAALDEDEYVNLRYTHQPWPRVHWLRSSAIQASATEIDPLFCVAPGEAPGQGETSQSQGEQLAPDQVTLNACEGHRYARLNAPQGYFSITFAEGDDLGIEPAGMTWVQLTLGADIAAQRGLTLATERGLPRELNIRYDNQRTGLIRTVKMIWERETSGSAAVTVISAETTVPSTDDFADDYWVKPMPLPPSDIWAGLPKAYVMWNLKQLIRTWDIQDASPTWEDITDATFLAAGYEIYDVQYHTTQQNEVIAYALTENGVYFIDDLLATTPVWTLVLSNATITAYDPPPEGNAVAASMALWGKDNNYITVAAVNDDTSLGLANGAVVCAAHTMWYSSDRGATWGVSYITDSYENLGYTTRFHYAQIYSLSQYRDNPGTLYCHRSTGSLGTGHRSKIFVSRDLGVTWTPTSQYWAHYSNKFSLMTHHPYPDATSPCWTMHCGVGFNGWLYQSTDEFETNTEIMGYDDGNGFEPAPGIRPSTDPFRSNHIIEWAYEEAVSDTYAMLESTDSGTSWHVLWQTTYDSVIMNSPVYTQTTAPFSSPNGWPADPNVWFVVSFYPTSTGGYAILMTDDNFATQQDKTGNLKSSGDFTSAPDSWMGWGNNQGGGFALPKVGVNA